MPSIALPRPRQLAWLPAALLIAYAIAAAAGLAVTPDSRAASSTTTVSASVSPELHMSLASCGTVGTTGTAANDWTWTSTITSPALTTVQNDVSMGTCGVSFGTNNNATGAGLYVRSSRAGANSLCINTVAITTDCGTANRFLDVTAAEAPATFAAGETAASGKFGMSYPTKTSCTGGYTTTDRHPLPKTTPGGLVCGTANTTDGSVTVDYRVNPGASQPAGTYQLQTIMQVLAN